MKRELAEEFSRTFERSLVVTDRARALREEAAEIIEAAKKSRVWYYQADEKRWDR